MSRAARRPAAFAAALLLLTQAATANHATFSVSLSSYATNAYADVSFFIDYGGDEAVTQEIQWPTGWLAAQQAGTSPITPIPDDEETVGSGTWTGKWAPFCVQGDQSLTITWEATIDAGAPANTVAQYTITVSGLFNTQVYLVRNGANDYDMEFPNMPDELLCASTVDGLLTLTFFGVTAGGRKVFQNPSTPGTYTFTLLYTDTGGTTHSTNADVTIV